ncbi:hypothetical protein BC835DRAFT_340270 [Cytidiella melzeri]|nr:hypothetical protein BC835DRAFT_340270 [Cytidiella melzeri]
MQPPLLVQAPALWRCQAFMCAEKTWCHHSYSAATLAYLPSLPRYQYKFSSSIRPSHTPSPPREFFPSRYQYPALLVHAERFILASQLTTFGPCLRAQLCREGNEFLCTLGVMLYCNGVFFGGIVD